MAQNKISIIYASTSGNVEIVVETVAEVLQAKGMTVTLNRAEQTAKEIFLENDLFILATSTMEHGAINPFYSRLLKEMQSLDLAGKKAAFIGLGDARYEPVYFNAGVEILKKGFLAAGGTEMFRTIKINGEPYKILETIVKKWAEDLEAVVSSL
ncbi:MAG: flavodoxin family protein [bacterium]